MERPAGEHHRNEPERGCPGPCRPRALSRGSRPGWMADRWQPPSANLSGTQREPSPNERARRGARSSGQGAGVPGSRAGRSRRLWLNAAVSSAVTAGINAKDALCFAMAGRSTVADDHKSTVNELRALGSAGREPATGARSPSWAEGPRSVRSAARHRRDARAAVRRANVLVHTAERVLTEQVHQPDLRREGGI